MTCAKITVDRVGMTGMRNSRLHTFLHPTAMLPFDARDVNNVHKPVKQGKLEDTVNMMKKSLNNNILKILRSCKIMFNDKYHNGCAQSICEIHVYPCHLEHKENKRVPA